MPTKDDPQGVAGAEFADGYGYDARVLPRKNVMLTTSFTGWKNYTNDFAKVAADSEALKQTGNSMVMWNFHTRQPKKVFKVPGSPLEVRWAWGEDNEQFIRAYAWDGKDLKPSFELDFTALKLGRPHHMLFGSSSMGPRRAEPAVAVR